MTTKITPAEAIAKIDARIAEIREAVFNMCDTYVLTFAGDVYSEAFDTKHINRASDLFISRVSGDMGDITYFSTRASAESALDDLAQQYSLVGIGKRYKVMSTVDFWFEAVEDLAEAKGTYLAIDRVKKYL